MKKKLVLMSIAAVLIISTVVGGALARSEVAADGAAQNKITLGNLAIDLVGMETVKAEDGTGLPGVIEEDALPGAVIADQNVQVKNAGEYDLYTKVTIKKYWGTYENGEFKKDFALDSNLIEVNVADSGDWIVPAGESFIDENGEEMVLFYVHPMSAGDLTSNLLGEIRISSEADNSYAHKAILITVEADGVQKSAGDTSVAADAMLNEWGLVAELDGDTLVSVGEK